MFTVDEKPQSTEENKSSKAESASGSSPSAAIPGLNFNAFDFSNMAGILNVSTLWCITIEKVSSWSFLLMGFGGIFRIQASERWLSK